MNSIQYGAMGTCITNRQYLATFSKKLYTQGDVEMHCSNTGLISCEMEEYQGRCIKQLSQTRNIGDHYDSRRKNSPQMSQNEER